MVVNDTYADSGEITIVWFNNVDVSANGIMYTLCFNVRETATDGMSEIGISYDANDNVNVAGANVIFTPVNGSVEIRSYWLGDLDGDRVFDMADLLQLAQYLSGVPMELTEKQMLSADVNEDGVIDVHDIVLLQQWLLNADI